MGRSRFWCCTSCCILSCWRYPGRLASMILVLYSQCRTCSPRARLSVSVVGHDQEGSLLGEYSARAPHCKKLTNSIIVPRAQCGSALRSVQMQAQLPRAIPGAGVEHVLAGNSQEPAQRASVGAVRRAVCASSHAVLGGSAVCVGYELTVRCIHQHNQVAKAGLRCSEFPASFAFCLLKNRLNGLSTLGSPVS